MLTITLTRRLLLLITWVAIAIGAVSVSAQVRLSPEEAEKLVVEKPEPLYPAIAKVARAQGIVRVEIDVSEEGKVTSAKVSAGHPLLQTSAASAVKRRVYRPHIVGGKPAAFVTTVDLIFSLDGSPPPSSANFENDAKVSEKFFKEEGKCRELVRSKTWKEAETVCGSAVKLAERFGHGRELEKMGAYELYGHALMGQNRFEEATEQYKRALDVVAPVIKETDAELASLYGNLAVSYHARQEFKLAFEHYRKAEKTYLLAHANIGKDDPEGDPELRFQQRYMKSLKKLLEFHKLAAEQAGAAGELEEVERVTKSLP